MQKETNYQNKLSWVTSELKELIKKNKNYTDNALKHEQNIALKNIKNVMFGELQTQKC